MKNGLNYIIRGCMLITIVIFLSSCGPSEKLISRGYTYAMIDGQSTVSKVWSPDYYRYKKKKKRFTFVQGHYRLIVGKKYMENVVRSRNHY